MASSLHEQPTMVQPSPFKLLLIGAYCAAACSSSLTMPGSGGGDGGVEGDGPQQPPPSCDRVTCGGHGTCRITNMGAMCDCEPAYHPVGSTCVSDATNLTELETLVAGMAAGTWY